MGETCNSSLFSLGSFSRSLFPFFLPSLFMSLPPQPPCHSHIIIFVLSLSSTLVFSWRALMHRKARFRSPIAHPMAINLSPVYEPIALWSWPVGEGPCIKGKGFVTCCCWSFLDSRDIKDAWLLQGQGYISIMPSPSCSIDVFAGFDGCAAARAILIYSPDIPLECSLFDDSNG